MKKGKETFVSNPY